MDSDDNRTIETSMNLSLDFKKARESGTPVHILVTHGTREENPGTEVTCYANFPVSSDVDQKHRTFTGKFYN